jgi:hypothetical protein
VLFAAADDDIRKLFHVFIVLYQFMSSIRNDTFQYFTFQTLIIFYTNYNFLNFVPVLKNFVKLCLRLDTAYETLPVL